MRVEITKMQGAGNDFVVLDETQAPLGLSRQQLRWLAHRQFGVGADQILVVGPSPAAGIDFSYRIFNADGGEVQHCGNGARCFVRYVRERGLTAKRSIQVRTINADLELTEREDGLVTVNMGAPRFGPASLPFDAAGLSTRQQSAATLFELVLNGPPELSESFFMGFSTSPMVKSSSDATFCIAIASMGNPHAVVQVTDVNALSLAAFGLWLRDQPRFAEGVNAGFMQVLDTQTIRLRVIERGVGETLACGTGACAAVACGIQAGVLAAGQPIAVHTRGGDLQIQWAGGATDPVMMSGPATTVFHTQLDVPDQPFLPSH
jgi:diaminopimelate epimerase